MDTAGHSRRSTSCATDTECACSIVTAVPFSSCTIAGIQPTSKVRVRGPRRLETSTPYHHVAKTWLLCGIRHSLIVKKGSAIETTLQKY